MIPGFSEHEKQEENGGAKLPNTHYHIGASQNEYIHLGTFLNRHKTDPAVKVRPN